MLLLTVGSGLVMGVTGDKVQRKDLAIGMVLSMALGLGTLAVIVGIGIGLVLLTVGTLVAPNRPDAEKLSPYECGFEAFEDARMKFDVRYYLVAILFILFDLEIAFLFPWAVVLPDPARSLVSVR